MNKLTIGFALTGSFCTFFDVIPKIQDLIDAGYGVLPIMSEYAFATDTKFGKAEDFRRRIEAITGRGIIHTITGAEPIGPGGLTDVMVVAPCTGNTLAKLAAGIADTSVTMSVKSHLRNGRPVVIAVSTNDALGGAAKNIGQLMNYKQFYFVPMGQDDIHNKPRSAVAHFDLILPTVKASLNHMQLQPVYLP